MSFDPERNIVLALVAQNENQVLRLASDGLAPGLSLHGYTQHVVDMMAPDGKDRLMGFLKEGRVAFAYGFAGVGAQFSLHDGTNLWTATRLPFAALWYDHPCYNYRQHIVESPYVLHCYHVLDHLEARRKHLPPAASRGVLLTMTEHFRVCRPEWIRPWKDRERKILYAKTALQPEQWAKEWKKHPTALQNILWALAEQAKKDRNLDLADAAGALFIEHGMAIDDLDLFMGVIQEVDAYIRAWRSDRLARALLPHPAHIVGRGWEYLSDQPRCAEILPPMPTPDYMKRMQSYRILGNSNPLWRHGIHERVYLGMNMGAVVLTDRSIRSDQIYAGLPNYAGFEWRDNLEDIIAAAFKTAEDDFADFYTAAEVAVHERVLAVHSSYFSQMLEAIKTTREHANGLA